MTGERAIEWHFNAQMPCETCGAHAAIGTPHRALTVVESEASKLVMGGREGAGYVVGYRMNEYAR